MRSHGAYRDYRDDGRLFQTSRPHADSERTSSKISTFSSDDGCTGRCRAKRSPLRVRRAEGDKVGNVRRTSLSGDLVHKHGDFELDSVLHWWPVKFTEIWRNVRPTAHCPSRRTRRTSHHSAHAGVEQWSTQVGRGERRK